MHEPGALAPTTALTVGIVTRNRPRALARCLASLVELHDLAAEIIVVDDTSDQPVERIVAEAPRQVSAVIRLVRHEHHEGCIAARNAIVRTATHDVVLLLDDDAYILGVDAVHRGLAVLDADERVSAVAFAQAEADGRPWPLPMQPARSSHTCQVPAYIGFAHLLRRRTFLELGGYREVLHFYGEEKDFCIRALEAGRPVVYLPEALVAHVPDRAGRSESRYLRHVIRNDCFYSLCNEPWPLPLVSVPLRLVRYHRMRRATDAHDPGGLWWIVSEVWRALPRLFAERRAVRWTTIVRWRRLARSSPPWPASA